MRWLIILFVSFLTGCSYTPVVDLRASKNEAQLFQRDLMECKELAKQVDFTIFPTYRKAVNNCIEGRGHSVLNQW
jgi:hypothetical protein